MYSRVDSGDRGIIPAYAGSTPGLCRYRLWRKDHPRIRGEHISCSRFVPAIMGSSPHTRGAPPRRLDMHVCKRIIPAYAGSTSPHGTRRRGLWDHPRIRGEHGILGRLRVSERGSSPHTRGAHRWPRWARSRGRIIPAYAGSTPERLSTSTWHADHPRIRGEHRLDIPWPQAMQGSSPHTRGALLYYDTDSVILRIIPAYAGSTTLAPRYARPRADHPRIRGEHQVLAVSGDAFEGSSPHTRGALRFRCMVLELVRIIPAYAGSTRPLRRDLPHRSDHPRIRGEHRSTPCFFRRLSGSSPHTRGALSSHPTCELPRRIIPAYAGSTRRRLAGGDWRADHPRIRGEHRQGEIRRTQAIGSSPHTRGAPSTSTCSPPPSRIIPAYAGSTRSRPSLTIL